MNRADAPQGLGASDVPWIRIWRIPEWVWGDQVEIGTELAHHVAMVQPLEDGKDGVPHANGKDGVPLANGKDGVPHANGKDGVPLANGKDGVPLEHGKDGVPPEPLLPLRLAGAVWGHLLGDAIGVPYEFMEPELITSVEFGASGTYGVAPGTWSDDGAMMLALLDSLLTGRFDPEDQGRRYLDWADRRRYTPDDEGRFDIGNATAAALARIRNGTPAEEAGGTTDRDNGNGSLMRAIPLALVGRDLAVSGLVDWALRASRVTHGHAVAGIACALYVLTARDLIRGQPERSDALAWGKGQLSRWLDDREASARATDPPRVVGGTPGAIPDPAPVDPVLGAHRAALDAILGHKGRAGRGFVVDSFWSAWDAFAGAVDYRETIERAIRYGHDTDTTAAIAGGLAGAYWGLDGIPRQWLRGMRGREVAGPLVDRLLASDGWKTSTSHPLRIDAVDLTLVPGLADAPGGLAMTFLPGKQRDGWTGLWWRDLDADAIRLREHGTDALLLLVEDHELIEARVPDVVERLAAAGIETIRHPVVDMDVPRDRAAYRTTLVGLIERIRAGRRIVVACRGGLGRTGTAVAALLVQVGMEPRASIGLTRASRRNTIERAKQEAFVGGWAVVDGTPSDEDGRA